MAWCAVMPCTSFAMGWRVASPIPNGRMPGILSSSKRRLAIRAWYVAQGGDPLDSHWFHQASSPLRASDSALNRVHQSFSIIESVLTGTPEPPHRHRRNLDITGCDDNQD